MSRKHRSLEGGEKRPQISGRGQGKSAVRADKVVAECGSVGPVTESCSGKKMTAGARKSGGFALGDKQVWESRPEKSQSHS